MKKMPVKDIGAADYVFISAMSTHKLSVMEIIEECKRQKTKTVGGGPLFTEEPELFGDVDHIVMNEAELTLPDFISDVEKGHPKKIYQTDQFPATGLQPGQDKRLRIAYHPVFPGLSVQL